MLSMFMGPYSLYLSLVYWIYPLNDYVGDNGCYLIIYGRDIGLWTCQLHSFFVATFRYVCLFHDKLLQKFDLSPKVSYNLKGCFFDRPNSKIEDFRQAKKHHNFNLGIKFTPDFLGELSKILITM